MAVYKVNGVSIQSVYDISGESKSSAYDINGNQLLSHEVDYSNYSYVQKWASKGIGNTQGFDIYNDKVFWVSKSGNATVPSDCYVFNLSDGSQALDTQYITIYAGHGNNLTFSKEFYAQGDTYPLLLASTSYSDSPAYLNRIANDYSVTLQKTYRIPIIENIVNGGFDICYGETSDVAYTASVFGSNSDPNLGTHICIAKWDMTNLTDNGDGTYTPTLISSVNADWHYWKQGIKYHDGYIWLASGYTNLRGYVYAIDPETGEIPYTIDCETNTEIEGAVWYPDPNAVGGYALYVGFYGMMLRKYTFSQN